MVYKNTNRQLDILDFGFVDQIIKKPNIPDFLDTKFSLDSVTQLSFHQIYVSVISRCWVKVIPPSFTHGVVYVEVSYIGSAGQLQECCLQSLAGFGYLC